MKRATLTAFAAALFATTAFTTAASAMDPALETQDYRRTDRRVPETPQHFAFELRFGPYKPDVDSEFSNGKTPYASTFGNGKGFHFGVEFDWQALRIPHFGTLGPGFGWGYSRRSAVATVAEGPKAGQDSGQSTYLTIMPMYADLVLRIDVLARDFEVPLVPYGKFGMGLGLWSSSTDNGISYANNPSTGEERVARGRSWGTHAALGGMFLLDILDRTAALGFDSELGVNNSYVFFEWQWSKLDGSFSPFEGGKQMHVGTSGWVLGLALEF